MKAWPGVVAVALLATLHGPANATAHSSVPASGRRVALARTNEVIARSTGYVPVSLSRAARISTVVDTGDERGPNEDLRVDGGGHFAGVLLEPDPPSPSQQLKRFYLGGTFRECAKGACAEAQGVVNVVRSSGNGRSVLLPAGRYRLYALTAGPPVHVTLRLSGLRGRTRISPSVHTKLDLHRPSGTETVAGTRLAYSWSADYSSSGSRGLALGVYWARVSSYAGHADGDCSYRPGSPPLDDRGFSAVCTPYMLARDSVGNPPVGPTFARPGSNEFNSYPPKADNVGRAREWSSSFLNFTNRARHTAYGIWLTSPTAVEDAWASAFFLSFD